MIDPQMTTAADVLSFWYSDGAKSKWFKPDAAFDAELRQRFEPALGKAMRGELAGWTDNADDALALIILLDQVPRNIYRGTPAAFGSDKQALDLANDAIARGLDERLTPERRWFLYLPFMHSENLADQERGIELFAALGLDEPLHFMRRHHEVIARFGRFPHRNAILGRPSTEEELEFLKQPGSHF